MPDPLSLAFIALAVISLGIAKGGFGGIGSPIALPLMSLGLPTELALGALLPILMSMDVVSISAHRKNTQWRMVAYALPGAAIGILIGTAVIALVSAQSIQVSIGILAVVFSILTLSGYSLKSATWPNWVASIFGSVAGLTSTIAHAGGPPIHIYLLSRCATPLIFAVVSAYAGVWVARTITKTQFKYAANILLFLVGLQLLWDALTA